MSWPIIKIGGTQHIPFMDPQTLGTEKNTKFTWNSVFSEEIILLCAVNLVCATDCQWVTFNHSAI